jgi:hypothetical protein
MTAPIRRWPKFTLRTLFVVMALVAIALAWTVQRVSWIQRRHAFLVQQWELAAAQMRDATGIGTMELLCTAPGFLWVFGEDGHGLIVVRAVNGDDSDLQETVELARRLFPEAEIKVIRRTAAAQ